MKKRRKSRGIIYRRQKRFRSRIEEKVSRKIIDLKLDGDLVGWTQSFIINKKIELIINGYINLEIIININIPQDFPVSPILFLIYISKVFKEVKKRSLRSPIYSL